MIREEFYRPPELIPAVDPGVYVPLDTADPIDARMIEHHNALAAGEFLDAEQQEVLVRGARGGDGPSIQKFVDAYEGLVATVAYGYKQYGVDSKELLIIGSEGLVQAAEAYTKSDISEFDERAVFGIETAILETLPGAPRIFADKSRGTSVEQVREFLEELTPSIKQEELNSRILEDFTPMQRKVLPLLHLGTHKKIADALGPPATRVSVNNITAACQEELDVHNTPSLALVLHSRGYRYPVKVPEKPLVELLTDYQFEIGNLLHHEYDEIGSLVGDKTEAQVRNAVHKMKTKTGARSRTELALMIAMFDTGERRDPEAVLTRKLGELASRVGLEALEYDDAERLLAGAESSTREVISPLYLTGRETSLKEVAGQLSISEKTARSRAEAGIRAMRGLRSSFIEQGEREN